MYSLKVTRQKGGHQFAKSWSTWKMRDILVFPSRSSLCRFLSALFPFNSSLFPGLSWLLLWQSEGHPTYSGPWAHASGWVRCEEEVLARLIIRIGHTCLNLTFIVKNEQPQSCELCDRPLAVEHILIECSHGTLTGTGFYWSHSLQDLFTNTDSSVIANFHKAVQVYDKL